MSKQRRETRGEDDEEEGNSRMLLPASCRISTNSFLEYREM